MSKQKFIPYLIFLILGSLSIHSFADVQVYGPGGPAPAMKEAAKQFTNKTGIAVHVTSGPTAQWSEKAKLDADVIYSGSEAMMSDFENTFSEQIIKDSVEPLYLRPAAILVRKGNPKILKDLKT